MGAGAEPECSQVLEPSDVSGSISCRNSLRKSNFDGADVGGQLEGLFEVLTGEGPQESASFPHGRRAGQPFLWKVEIKISGVAFDSKMCFRTHVQNLLCKAKLRHCVKSKTCEVQLGAGKQCPLNDPRSPPE